MLKKKKKRLLLFLCSLNNSVLNAKLYYINLYNFTYNISYINDIFSKKYLILSVGKSFHTVVYRLWPQQIKKKHEHWLERVKLSVMISMVYYFSGLLLFFYICYAQLLSSLKSWIVLMIVTIWIFGKANMMVLFYNLKLSNINSNKVHKMTSCDFIPLR